MTRPTLSVLLAAAAALAACVAPRGPAFADRDYPGTLLPAGTFATDLLWQQRITATWGEGAQRGFDAAVQKQAAVLTVLGLSPAGYAGFVILLRGTDVELQNQAGEDLPFPPRFVLLDVQRTFYPWLPMPTPRDGEREGVVAGERVRERWADGRLQQRRFERLDATPPGTITITYDWTGTEPSWQAPRHVVLDNGWFGYRLTVDTHAETRLPPPAGG
ncbi:MAG: DUF3261 domain-containing protein [Planctomycetes bacterium]|nr:DUF3261 domain-containing protein [Planctomycetota bacterium]